MNQTVWPALQIYITIPNTIFIYRDPIMRLYTPTASMKGDTSTTATYETKPNFITLTHASL